MWWKWVCFTFSSLFLCWWMQARWGGRGCLGQMWLPRGVRGEPWSHSCLFGWAGWSRPEVEPCPLPGKAASMQGAVCVFPPQVESIEKTVPQNLWFLPHYLLLLRCNWVCSAVTEEEDFIERKKCPEQGRGGRHSGSGEVFSAATHFNPCLESS